MPKSMDIKPVNCYKCGDPMIAARYKTTYDMRIDGVIHVVPVYAVPCTYCVPCDLCVTDAGSDEAMQWSFNKYLNENGLNTPYLRLRRWLIRRWQYYCDTAAYRWYKLTKRFSRTTE